MILLQKPDFHAAVKNPMPVKYAITRVWRNITNYQVVCRVSVETYRGSGVYNEKIVLPAKPDEDNQVLWNISSILESFVKSDPPNISFASARICAKMNISYSLMIEEEVTGSFTLANTPLGPYRAAWAGCEEGQFGQLESMITAGKFLTNQPRKKAITPNQPEWLNFGIPSSFSTGNFQLMAQILYEDGSTSSAFSGPQISANPGDIIQFGAGYNMLRLGTAPTAIPVIGYQLWVKEVSSGNEVSERMQYRFDHCECSPLDRFYVFENTYGGFDTIRTTGIADVKSSTSGSDAFLIADPSRTAKQRSLINFGITHHHAVEQHIGYQNEVEQIWLQELLAAKEGFRIGEFLPNPDAEGEMVPIKIELTETELYRDNQFLHPLSFTYRDAFNSRGFK